jgi:hypothetical protein
MSHLCSLVHQHQPSLAEQLHRSHDVRQSPTQAHRATVERNPPLRLSSMESTSDQNIMRVEIESASSASSREKIPIKGVVPD